MVDYSINIIKDTSYTIELNEQGPQGIQGERGIQGPEGPVGPKGDKGDVGDKGDTGVSVVGVEEISKVGLVTTYRMEFSNGEYFDYQVTDGSIDGLTREQVISLIGYEPASYTSVEGLTTRVTTLEERVEDLTTSKFPNVVIIGTPHIEGGQVSGYSKTDYLQFPFVDISRGLPFDIYFSFTTGSDVTTQQNILDSYFGIALAIQNSKGIMALSSNGTSWDIGNVTGTNTILPNTTYYAKCSWTGTQYNASLSTNDTTYTPDMVLSSTLTTNKTTIFIGGSPDLFGADTANPFKGTINFNNSRVDVQGTTVWKGMADVGLASRANVSLNNLDEVGEKRFTDIQIALDGKQDKGKSGSGLEVCDIGTALYVDETKGLRRYLNGQIVDINTNTQKFLDRLKQITTLYPSLLCTEEEWQTAKTMSAFGQVGKFVFNYNGDNIVSVRIPRVVNVQGLFDLQNLGLTVGQALPSHTHTRGTMDIGGTLNIPLWTNRGTSGAFYELKSGGVFDYGSNSGGYTAGFTASRNWTGSTSAPNYSGTVATGAVQQEAIQYPYFIQIATGQETENNITNEIELNNPYSLFDSKYSDHELNNLSWLKSEGQWNAKAVYPTAYDKLLKVQNGTETVEGLSVKLSTETYTDYDFVLNTADETFRLPLLDGSESLLSDNYTELSFPAQSTFSFFSPYNGWASLNGKDSSATGSFYVAMRNQTRYFGTASGFEKAMSSAWRANVLRVNKGDKINIYTQGTIPFNTDNFVLRVYKATGNGSLYFYVGETVQNANLIDAGRIGEILPTKLDASKVKAYIVETYQKGTSWYRIWSDGWCEQGGQTAAKGAASTVTTVNFLKPFANANYCALATDYATTTSVVYFGCTSFTTSSMAIITNAGAGRACRWMVAGYIN